MSEPKETQAVVTRVTSLCETIVQVILTPQTFIDYEAGQYLEIHLGDDRLCYSIANAPSDTHQYELHIRHTLDSPLTEGLLAKFNQDGKVQITLPFGTCSLKNLQKDKPLLFIAGGTGFAPIKAIIEQLHFESDPRPFELYWGARNKGDLYLAKEILNWKSHCPYFKFLSLLTETSKETLASMVLKRHSKDLREWQLLISGPYEMAYVLRDTLLSAGGRIEDLYSDAFIN